MEAETLGNAPTEDLQDLYENAPCGYLSLLPDGRIFKVNATFLVWTGYTREQLIGKLLRDLLSVAARIFYETHFAPLLRMQGYFHEVALDIAKADGSRLAVLANAVERRGADEKLLFTRVSLFQATERRRYERELVDARTAATEVMKQLENLNARLESRIASVVAERLSTEGLLLQEKQAAELREHFIAVLGHDLRNPLASVKSGLRMLSREPASEKAKAVLALMEGSADRMSNLINDVMDLARGRLGGGIGLMRQENQALEPVLRQVVQELQASRPERAIVTSFDLLTPVTCDPTRIGQMASNLIGNALTHGAADQPVRVKAKSDEDLLEIEVANGGKPIPALVMQKLFQPFFRGADPADQQGLGLGLYIASEIAKAHGGRLTVKSNEIETRFQFQIPNHSTDLSKER
ncbi:PAS domain-containing sensor histidine kinase [Rhizobium sp. R339]|uniref:PAS domain-containing sensor histidine kinase n=1 Tax=Rhizobium sp. R339 TaxID=1764273 RepID=UPI000B52AFF4|nr:PAS domain-containing sensor histidine kinase [Rhizobium sp. R339]OWV65549.1 PAS domain-containing sensor histidine kinase [Rhizobium sp. R339]